MFTEEYISELIEDSLKRAEYFIAKKDLSNGIAILRQIIEVNPSEIRTLSLLANCFVKQGKFHDAEKIYKKLLEENYNYQTLNDLAISCYRQCDYDNSIKMLQQAIQLEPTIAVAYGNIALCYEDKGDVDNSFRTYSEAFNILTDDPNLFYQYGIFLNNQGLHLDAINYYEKAININPVNANYHHNLSYSLLLTNQYERGFAENEYRLAAVSQFRDFIKKYDRPAWTGEDINGKTILIFNEQGAGDYIVFVRYLPFLKEKGATIVAQAPSELTDLLLMSGCIDKVISQTSKNIPEHDYVCSIGSLPHILMNAPYTPVTPYLRPTGSVPLETFSKYEHFTKIGICWAGNPSHRRDHERSIMLKLFKPIHDIENVKLFSLQKDLRKRYWPNKDEIDLCEEADGLSIVDMSDIMINFNYTAAIIEQMDLVISVDTAIAHLAGAMGKPCWVLVPYVPDWRWGLEKDSTSWYNSIKIYRQRQKGDWDGVFRNVIADLNALFQKTN